VIPTKTLCSRVTTRTATHEVIGQPEWYNRTISTPWSVRDIGCVCGYSDARLIVQDDSCSGVATGRRGSIWKPSIQRSYRFYLRSGWMRGSISLRTACTPTTWVAMCQWRDCIHCLRCAQWARQDRSIWWSLEFWYARTRITRQNSL